MTILTEALYPAECLVSEAPGDRSREAITVLSGQDLDAGEVLGRITRAVGKADIPSVVGTGNGVMSALFAGPDVEDGNYVVTCISAVTNGGVFSVLAPSGEALPTLTLTVGAGASTNYLSSHINFTVTDGSTDFIATDAFTIAVAAGAPTIVGTGNGTLSAITMGAATKPGRYLFVCVAAATNAGDFELLGPFGESLGTETITGGAGGTAVFSNPQLNATVTDGSTDFAAGDFFEVVVWNVAEKKAKAWDPSGVDGSEDVCGFLLAPVDASAADNDGVAVVSAAVVNSSLLQYASTVTAAQQTVALKRLAERGIAAR